MHGDNGLRGIGERNEPPAIGIDGYRLAHETARRRRAHRYRDGRLNEIELVVEPPTAGVDLACVWLLVDALLAARLILEVLHRVGDVDLAPLDARCFQRLVEHLAGWADEGEACQILLVARLLADEYQRRVSRTLAEHGLGRVLIEIATGAAACFDSEQLERLLGVVDPLFLEEIGFRQSGHEDPSSGKRPVPRGRSTGLSFHRLFLPNPRQRLTRGTG